MKNIIDQIYNTSEATGDELLKLLKNLDEESTAYLHARAHEKRLSVYGNKVFMRGLIEFTNYCKSNCMYCGIRRDNKNADRYRLDTETILECCREGHELGYRTFVLQGGEDPFYADEDIVTLVKAIKSNHPDCAITLSIGEKSKESYRRYKDAGADRFLLRHETNTKTLYEQLHPDMSYEARIRCLEDLKEIGYQVGAGFMVGLPGQGNEDYVGDLLFLKKLQPHMVGIGPFIPQQDTPLASATSGTLETTCIMLSLVRLLLPKVLLPATTALGSLDSKGRERGLQAGGNVVMPNLSPTNVRDKYLLYDGKICTGDEAAHCRGCIERRIQSVGFEVDMSRGDHVDSLTQK
ncbi:MAG: [FeFe] hydrogenase H-cluster radical SAM maturase HydE [Vallitaleaceae bacterium]|nr:[FeFe] hydrogenase H-cluster radical SAM maturase HydE [Vallitaleaceae bacterium]